MSEQKKKVTLKILSHETADAKKTPMRAQLGDKTILVHVWNRTMEKDGAKYAIGTESEFELENRPFNNQDQYFIWRPNGGGGNRGGGQAKSDPVKNALIQNANHLNNATACMNMAVTLLGAGADINQVRLMAHELAVVVKEVARTF